MGGENETEGRAATIERLQLTALAMRRGASEGWPNSVVIQMARTMDNDRRAAAPGSLIRLEYAAFLLRLYQLMERRIQAAPLDSRNGLPLLDGVTWNGGSPLAGSLEDIQPFGWADVWTTESRHLIPLGVPTRRHRVPPLPVPPQVQPPDPSDTPQPIPIPPNPGGDLGRAARPGRGLEPGFVDEIIGAEGQTFGNTVLSLVGEILGSGVLNVVGAVLSNVAFLNTIDSVYRTEVRTARSVGLRLGVVALDLLRGNREGELIDVSRTRLLRIILEGGHGNMAAEWYRQIQYGVEVPGGVRPYMENAVGEIAAAYRHAVQQTLSKLRERSSRGIPPELLQEIRRRVRDHLAESFRREFQRH